MSCTPFPALPLLPASGSLPAWAAVVAVLLTGCGQGRGPSERPPDPGRAINPPVSVVAADGVLCDLTRTLAGPDAGVSCLLEGGEDPHSLALRPAQRRQLEAATLVLVNGFSLTPALAVPEGSSRVVAVAERADIEPVKLAEPEGEAIARSDAPHRAPAPDHHHSHQHSHGAGHSHSGGDLDPHVWHNPLNTAAMAAVVVEQLAAIRPDARASIGRRAAEARRILRSLDAWAGVQIATIPTQRRVLATPHRAFATFAARYGLKEMALIDAGSGSEQLRPRDLERLRVSLRQEAVPMLFFEGETPPRALRAISARSGVPLAPEPLAADGVLKGQSLVATFVHNTCTVVNGLGGRCDRGGGEALEEAWRRIGIGRSSRLPAGSPSPAQGEPAP